MLATPGAWRAIFTTIFAFGTLRALAAPSSVLYNTYNRRGTRARLAPAPGRRGAAVALSQSEADVFEPYAYFAGAAYCKPVRTLKWDCGGASLTLFALTYLERC